MSEDGVEIKFSLKELELMAMLAGAALMDKDVLKSFKFSLEERLAFNNKIMYLKIQAAK